MVRELPEQTTRVETGPVRFGSDWTGVFIRGDEAFAYSMYLKSVLERADRLPVELTIPVVVLTSLADTLASCDERNFQ